MAPTRPSWCPRCCASARGSAATATAIPSSPTTSPGLGLRLQAREVLKRYRVKVEHLALELTHSSTLVTPSEEFLRSLDADADVMPSVLDGNPQRYAQEPYRLKLHVVHHRLGRQMARLEALLDGRPDRGTKGCYADEAAFIADLEIIGRSLASHGDRNLAEAGLKDLILQARTFGFFLAQLDIRQESGRHTQAVAELFARAPNLPDYLSLDEAGRVKVLDELLSHGGTPLLFADQLSPETREILDVLNTVRDLSAEISPRAFGAYVISMTHQASHVLEVMFLMGFAGLAGRRPDGTWHCALENLAPVRDHRRSQPHPPGAGNPAGPAVLSRPAGRLG
ncbi:MAG: phosphoenolpyruvate carboxylase [Magnetospirillum sp.]|nr:phosphoenolpyruvate carboxylase [Magnetospirillum sp.]